jgi:preprotein translocase subunit SecD
VRSRARGLGLLAVVLILAACDSGGSAPSSSPSTRPDRAALEIRPIQSLLPPGDPTVPADADLVVEPESGNGLRYALGPAALSGSIVRRARAEDLGGTGRSWIVDIRLTPSAARQYEALGRRLADREAPQNAVAVLVDGVMESQTAFDPSSADFDAIQIAGTLTGRQARELAASLDP